MDNNIEVDYEELTKQLKEEASKDGVVIEIIVPQIKDISDLHNIDHISSAKAHANPVTLAFAIMQLETTAEQFKKGPDVVDALEILRLLGQVGTHRVDLKQEDKDGD